MDLIFNRLVNLTIVALSAHLASTPAFMIDGPAFFGAILFLFGAGFALAQNWRHASVYAR
jgi:hypothetical protein